MSADVQFTCPLCGSHHFGSAYDATSPPDRYCQYCRGSGHITAHSRCSCIYDTKRGAVMTGCCHGPTGCRFIWNRKDDAKYFKPVKTHSGVFTRGGR